MSLPIHVTIVIPVLNGAKTLGELLASLTGQSYPKQCCEILVVDNGSRDQSVQIARAFGVTVLQEAQKSSYRARNRGIAEARGEIVAFTDTDCIADKHWLTELVVPFADPEVGGVAGTLLHPWGKTLAEAYCAYYKTPNHCRTTQQNRPPHAVTANVAYRRQVFEDLGNFDESFLSQGDVDFSWRLQLDGRWRLHFQNGSAQISHRSPTRIGELRRKFNRYGRGMADLQRKYPQYTLAEQAEPLLSYLKRPTQVLQLAQMGMSCALSCRQGKVGWQTQGFPLVASLLQEAFCRGFVEATSASHQISKSSYQASRRR